MIALNSDSVPQEPEAAELSLSERDNPTDSPSGKIDEMPDPADQAVAELTVLTGRQRRYLRSLAHGMHPAVSVGKLGLGEGTLREIDRALTTHELVKLRISRQSAESPQTIGARVGAATRSNLVGLVGRVVMLYRRRRKGPSIVLPGPRRPEPDTSTP